MKLWSKSLILIITLNLINTHFAQSSNEFKEFVDPMGVSITGVNAWKDWTGMYYPNRHKALLKNPQTHEIRTFTDIHVDKTVINNPKGLLIEFAIMPNPNSKSSQNLFSDHVTLLSPKSPLILMGKKQSTK